MSQSLIEDILHRVTLTKIISNSTEASGWARLSFPLVFTWISFVSVLLIIVNWDRKENHHVLASFYELASLPRERHKGQPDRGAPRVQRSRSRWGPLAAPHHSLPWRRSGQCQRPWRERLEWPAQAHETATPGEGWGGGRSAQTSRERVVRGGRSREGSQGRLERSSSALRLTTSSSSPTLAALLPNSVEFSYFMRVTIIFIVSPMSKARIHVLSRK